MEDGRGRGGEGCSEGLSPDQLRYQIFYSEVIYKLHLGNREFVYLSSTCCNNDDDGDD